MLSRINKAITYSFLALFFLTPLILYTNTSEVFEFNKIVFTYLITILVISLWVSKMIIKGKFYFKKTPLDIPLLVFLASQLLSTLVSFDPRASLFGYYSRFHGGLLSSISYSLLYWAFVSNMDKEKTKKAIYAFLAAAVSVSIYAVAQHFGIDKDVWIQDVQNRVFSTFGQPNWLAAWLAALLPITWLYFAKREKEYLYLGLSSLIFLTLLYTKSRSGILGFIVAYILFWTFLFIKERKEILKKFIKVSVVLGAIILLVGTPWTSSLSDLSTNEPQQDSVKQEGPALEVGGTESGEIRKIVWTGAYDIWKNYPILGTGVETFAYSYYNFRPEEHNLVSEWNFLYNKAHNEYLNIAATTGTLGLLSYLTLIGITTYIFIKKRNLFTYTLLSGFVSILVTNFFGFSVVPIATLFFLFPAFAIANDIKKKNEEKIDVGGKKKAYLAAVTVIAFYLVYLLTRYWYADYTYARGKRLNDAGNLVVARDLLQKAKNLSPKEALYWDELADVSAETAVFLYEDGQEENANELSKVAINESEMAISLSPKNVNLRRSQASMFIKLSTIDQNHLLNAREALIQAITLAPTDAHLYYNLGLTEARIGNAEDAKRILEQAVELKDNYRDARLALALILAEEGGRTEAREHLIYILENINPEDALVQQQLEELGGR